MCSGFCNILLTNLLSVGTTMRTNYYVMGSSIFTRLCTTNGLLIFYSINKLSPISYPSIQIVMLYYMYKDSKLYVCCVISVEWLCRHPTNFSFDHFNADIRTLFFDNRLAISCKHDPCFVDFRSNFSRLI